MEDWPRLRPTQEQYANFGEYLCEAHSWYKHLSLLNGGRFVVFVACDSGIGRLVAKLHGADPEAATHCSLITPAEGPEFTDEHPRLHYGWKTTKEYRSRFGYLDYMWCDRPETRYARDAGAPVRLPAQVEERCGFILYPYVSWTFFAETVTTRVHKDAIAKLRAGAAHPARDRVIELANLAEAREITWNSLSEVESDWVVNTACNVADHLGDEPTEGIRKYIELDAKAGEIADILREMETEKIRHALTELDKWLLNGE